jgi:Fic family protein
MDSLQEAVADQITNPQTRDRYIQSSLIEEAITSSQLEGASTTREKAKELLRSGRVPIDQSEKMIVNNYRAIQLVTRLKDQPLSRELLFTLHQTVTEGTLLEGVERHYLRQPGDNIGVYDNRDHTLLHEPPPASQIPERIDALCRFANEVQSDVFLHPVLKAIILHFWFAYDRPSIVSHQTSHDITYQTARTDLLDLAKKQLLRKTKTARAFVFSAPPDLAERVRKLSR